MARPSNNRTNKMMNKKTQKQGRSKRGGVGFNPFALLPALLFGSAIVEQANQAGKQLTNPMEGFKIQILTPGEMRSFIKPETMKPEELKKINDIIPIQQVVVDNDNKVMSGVTPEEDMPKQFVYFNGVTPDMFRDIEGFNAWHSGYGARESMVPVTKDSVVFVKDGMIYAVPPVVTVTEESVKNAMIASVEKMFVPTGLDARPSFEMLSDGASGGGSRKKRPKTKRRSKRY